VPGKASAARAATAMDREMEINEREAQYLEIVGKAVIFVLPWNLPSNDDSLSSWQTVPRFIVAKIVLFCHKPDLHRPADQGLPWR
jgi:hypothetical protein